MAKLGDRAAGPDAVAGSEPAAGEGPAVGEEPAETQWPGIAAASPLVVKVGSSSLTTARGGIDELDLPGGRNRLGGGRCHARAG